MIELLYLADIGENVYVCEYLVYTVIYLVPNCGVGYLLDVVRIVR